MPTLLIIWHSRTGTARQLADALADGAMSSDNDCAVVMVPAVDATARQLLDADGYVFACPENLASMTGAMKEMVDTHYYALLDQVAGRPCALIVAAGTDGEGAVRQWRRILTGWRMKLIAEPMIVRTGADTPERIAAPKSIAPSDVDRAWQLGVAFATGLALGVY